MRSVTSNWHSRGTQLLFPFAAVGILSTRSATNGTLLLSSAFGPSLQVLKQFRALQGEGWQVLDAAQSIDAVQQQLRAGAGAAVERCRRGSQPLQRLWDGGELQHAPGN